MLNRGMVALTRVMEQQAVTAILGNGEAHSIAVPLGGQSSALPRIAEIAEIFQLRVAGRPGLACGSA